MSCINIMSELSMECKEMPHESKNMTIDFYGFVYNDNFTTMEGKTDINKLGKAPLSIAVEYDDIVIKDFEKTYGFLPNGIDMKAKLFSHWAQNLVI